ncbi:MAG: phosphoglycerate dehydrogenase [Alphaproteobacteria bacterium]|nr:phosphoglycerate dehydrogenase [Alphaproteobacteria bacterium]MDE2113102.1 phosphoglycerate dehydrogenase [Alphaproteobacteria bacterium]MDE2495222.1 phosphoglycerate dehydrogenase [Alphaproteobacteria bacterium]
MNDTLRIAVASRSFSKNPVLRQELLARYSNVTFNDAGVSMSGDALLSFLKGHDRAIIALEKLDEAAIAQLPDLKVVSKYGVGIDNVDLAALRKHGKRLGWTPGVNRRSVAELALGFMIALLHNVPSSSAVVRGGSWQQVKGRQLTGKTIGIIGCGNVGKDLVTLLQPFGVSVLAHDIVDYREFYQRYSVEPVGLDDLMRRSDVVTIHVPLDASTRGLISVERIAMMKNGAVLLNTARGGIVDDLAAKQALISGRLAGIGFDVFAVEPPEDRDFLNMPTVLATPHIGGSAEEAILAMGLAAIQGLVDNAVP